MHVDLVTLCGQADDLLLFEDSIAAVNASLGRLL